MTTAARRQQLLIYLADATDEKVEALFTLLEGDMGWQSTALTAGQLQILAQRKADFLSCKSKPVPWEEVQDRITNKRKSA
jgi:hypothetical protein